MPQIESPTPLSRREAAKARHDFQKRKAEIARTWISWQSYYKETYESDPQYERRIKNLSIRISQEIALEANVRHKNITWPEARSRLLKGEDADSIEAMYGKSFRQVCSDVGKWASHLRWYKGIYARGEGGILYDVIQELRECSNRPQIAISTPPEPIVMTAKEIREEADRRNRELRKAQQEFLGDPPKKSGTAEFDFLPEIDRQIRLKNMLEGNTSAPKKPRKDWRRER